MRQRVETQSSGGVVLGRYRIVRRLAQGGMGVVYLGRLEGAAGFSKAVVIKRVIPNVQNLEETTARFIREAQILSHLQHPGIVSVLDFGEEVGGHCMVLEYVHGYDLSKWLKFIQINQLSMHWEHAVFILLQVLEALSYSHNFRRSDGSLAEVLHRDVSPGNILIDLSGRVRLTDFGIARMSEADGSQYKTQTGVISGKMTYLAPELFSSNPPSASSDVYACGVVLYQMLTGKSPFAGETASRVMWRVMTEQPTPLSVYRDDLPDELERAVLNALEKTPEARYSRASEFAEDLRSLLTRREAAIGAEVREQISQDFTGNLPEQLHLEPLAEREAAWRTGSGMPPAASRSEPELRMTFSGPGAAQLHGAAGSDGELREQATARLPRRSQANHSKPSDASQSGAGLPPANVAGRSLVAAGAIASLVVIGGIAAQAWPSGASTVAPSSERFIVVGERKPIASPILPKPAEPTAVAQPVQAVKPRPAVSKPSKIRKAKTRSQKIDSKESASAALARQVAKSHGALQNCFRSNTTKIQGRPSLHLTFSLNAAGEVTSVGVKPPSVTSTALGKCIVGVARRTRFEPQGKVVTFSIPIRARTESK